mmetsp:Transcript_59724/g.133045  ORF Transcript_59724/g.133045 Transcript_59724/m.133045 type:complete len:283 (-) Transcript_59724:230-1078(-)
MNGVGAGRNRRLRHLEVGLLVSERGHRRERLKAARDLFESRETVVSLAWRILVKHHEAHVRILHHGDRALIPAWRSRRVQKVDVQTGEEPGAVLNGARALVRRAGRLLHVTKDVLASVAVDFVCDLGHIAVHLVLEEREQMSWLDGLELHTLRGPRSDGGMQLADGMRHRHPVVVHNHDRGRHLARLKLLAQHANRIAVHRMRVIVDEQIWLADGAAHALAIKLHHSGGKFLVDSRHTDAKSAVFSKLVRHPRLPHAVRAPDDKQLLRFVAATQPRLHTCPF